MTEAVTAPYANLRERPSTRFGSMVESGKQPGQQFAEFVPAITAITGKWHEQFSKNQIFTAGDLSTPFLTSQNADFKNIARYHSPCVLSAAWCILNVSR